MNHFQVDHFEVAFSPRFGSWIDLHLHSCVHCHKKRVDNGVAWVRCPCKSCIYCSNDCRSKDKIIHRTRCRQIQEVTTDIQRKANNLGREHPPRCLFKTNFPHNIYSPDETKMKKLTTERNNYLDARIHLIKELIREGCRRDPCNAMTRKNDLALDIAIVQCKDLLFLCRKDSDLILNYLYLLTGRFQDSYDLSCYFARKGDVPLGDHELDPILNDCVRHQNITKSYFKRGAKDGNFYVNFDYQSCHWTAICQMYVVKYLLYMEMEKLISINKCFLENQDCMVLIGEYAGMKKEWIVNDKNWYRDQAFEVFRLFHIEQFYFYLGVPISDCFQQMKEFAVECFPSETSRAIDTAIEAGVKWIGDMKLHQKQEKTMSPSRWAAIIKNYESDHNLIYTINIRPALPLAIMKVNAMAGYDAIGMNVDNNLGVTEFVTEVINACNGRSESFYELITFMVEGSHGEEDYEEEDFDLYGDFHNNGCFSRAIGACLLIEQKLAQCHFHKNKESDETKKILELLPGGKESYTSDPPEEDPGGPFLNLFESFGGYDTDDDIVFTSKWLPDVTKVVDALFKAGLATNENLRVLFGKSGFASYRIWDAQKIINERTQKSIESFITRSRFWKEGCIDHDKKLGLKIQYLNKLDRKQRFDETKMLVPMGKFIQYLEPSLEQFVKKFGWDNLGIKSDQDLFGYSDKFGYAEPIDLVTKKRRCELDGFLTVEEACRYYFDTASFEEAMWDLVGIPRLIVLNGDMETMQKSGWKNSGSKSVLGDKSVQLGSRVAYVYSGSCMIWEEQKPRSTLSDTDMETDQDNQTNAL